MKFWLLSLVFFANCSVVFYRSMSVNLENFQYEKISKAYFGPHHEEPFPLTARRGVNIFGRTTKDGKFLFFASDVSGNMDILFRDLQTSVIVPVTRHPSTDTKPAIHPSGKKIAFVSERFDSEGDILIMDIDPKEWLEEYLKGNRLALSQSFICPTNVNYKDPSKIERYIDTDPTWSPDGRYIAFVTNRFNRSLTNLALIDTKENYKIIQLTEKGGASPIFSPDGKNIYYVSYKDQKQGEIYKLNLETKQEERITNDVYIDLSPSVSEDGRFLIYTSIRKDSNDNGKIGLRDHAYIIRVDLQTNKRLALSAGKFSLFDTYYSNFNGGSILFSASLKNALNVYFIPLEGEIPKQPNIQLQYEFAKLYKERRVEFHELAYNAIFLYYGNDPLYPLYKSRADRQLVKEYEEEGNYIKANEILQEMLKQKDDPLYGFSYALAISHLKYKRGEDPIPELIKYYESYKNRKDVHPQIPPSILYWIGEVYSKQLKPKQALETYREILTLYPDFYRILELKRFISEIEYEFDHSKIPKYYIEILGQQGIPAEDNRFIIEDLHSDFLEISNLNKRLSYLEELIKNQPEIKNNSQLLALINYTKAETLAEKDEFQESIKLLEAISKQVKYGSYIYLKSKMLLVNILEKKNLIKEAQNTMREFIEAYNYEAGYKFSQDELEESLNFFEVKAKLFEVEGDLQTSTNLYAQNNKLLALAIEKKLPVNKVVSKYSSFYHKKFIESAFNLSQQVQKTKDSSILQKVNVVKKLDVQGRLTETLAWFFRWEYFRYFGDFRDLQYLQPLEPIGIDILEKYYDENLERAKENLDLGTVFGYAYFLVNLATREEQYFIQENALTEARKKTILRKLRQAEYELLWTIYADPTYLDAYMLLGWLYQYIDIRKQTLIFPEEKPDGEVFYSLYLKSFPRKYLEENIDLYTQVLEFLGKKIHTKNLANVHLNLANNYFLLNNFQKALAHYQEVEILNQKILESSQFESYRQEGLFYFNYARALIYNSKVSDSIPMLEKALDIYYKNEYYPIISALGTREEKSLKKALEDTRKKIALLHALVGLAELELEKYQNAISSFITALAMNSEVDYINNISLYNSLAICYQKIGNYKKSELSLDLATNEYIQKKNLLDYFDFSIWDIILPDPVRVIGDGRFISEFPLEFSNLLTQGIRIQNYKDKKDFQEASNLIQARFQFIKSKKLNSFVMGQKILDQTSADLGYNEFLKGNYKEAEKYYKEHYKQLENQAKDKEAFASFFRSSISLFSHMEQNQDKVEFLENELLEELNFLNKIYKNEMKQCLPKDKEISNEKIFECERQFLKNYLDYDIVLGYVYFYLAELSYSQANLEKAFEYYGKALGLLKNPAKIPDSEIGLDFDLYTKKERARLFLAQAIIYHRIGENEKSNRKIKEAYNYAIEFNLERELLGIYIIEAEIKFKYATKNLDYLEIISLLDRAENLLRNSLGLFLEIDEIFLNYLFALKSSCFVKLNRPIELRKNREKLYSSIFFRQLLVNELRFQDIELFKTLNEIQYHVLEDKEYSEKIQRLLQDGKNPTATQKQRSENHQKLLSKINFFQSKMDRGVDLFSWLNKPIEIRPKLDLDEAVIEIYSTGRDYLLSILTHTQTEIIKFSVYDNDNLNEVAEAITKALESRKNIRKLVLIPSPLMYGVQFNKLPYKGKTLNDFYEIRYLFRFSQLEREKATGFSRLRRVTSIDTREIRKKALLENIFINPLELILQPTVVEEEKLKELNLRIVPSENLVFYLMDTDILEGPTDYSNRKQYIGERLPGLISIKEVVENQWNVPLLVLNNYKRSQDNFLKNGFLYDILQFAGVQSIVLIENIPQAEKIRNKLISNIKHANQIIQEEKLILIGEKINPYPENNLIYEEEFKKFTNQGISFERKKKYLEAMKSFLQANSVLPDNRLDLQIESEVHIARAKTNLFPNKKNYLVYFEDLLKKLNPNQPQEEKVLYELLLNCYGASINLNCEPYYKRYMSQNFASQDRKKVIEFYRNLQLENSKYVEENYENFLSLDSNEDEFLKNIKLAKMFSRASYLDKALKHAKLALTKAKVSYNQEEIEIAENKLIDIEFEMYFIQGIDIGNLTNINSLFSLGKSKEWKKYKSRLDDLLKNEFNYFKKSYIQRIYNSYDNLNNSSEFEVLNLGPILMNRGKNSLFLLKEEDRNFLFHILLLASNYQMGSELNSQIDLITQTEEKLQNKNRLQWMRLEWAGNLYYKGDYKEAKKYFELFEENITYLEPSLQKDYLLLKFKLAKIFSDIKINPTEEKFLLENFTNWIKTYQALENTKNEIELSLLLTNFLTEQKTKTPNKKLDFFQMKEFSDLLNSFLRKAILNNWVGLVFEIVAYREKFFAYNERILGKTPQYSNIPNFKLGLSQTWKERMPKGQELKVVFDYGVETYLLELKEGKYPIQKIFDNNKEVKIQILSYIYKMKQGGSFVLEAKALESMYRKAINLEPKKLIYLYFTSYHIKAPIESLDIENFYYIFNPELIAKREYYSAKDDFLVGFKIQTYKNSNFSPSWWTHLKKLEQLEYSLNSGTGKGKNFLISMEELIFQDGKVLRFGNFYLPSLENSTIRQKAPWAITGSLLAETSLKNEDFINAMYFLDYLHFGPGVVEVIDQKNSHVAYFMKNFLTKKDMIYPFQERFTDAISQIKRDWKEDRYWIGWKPCTNVFILE